MDELINEMASHTMSFKSISIDLKEFKQDEVGT